MKKNKNELVRVKNILGNDRFNVGESFYELLLGDVDKLLKEYFDYKSLPKVYIEKKNGNLHVNIYVEALCAKYFGTIPQNIENTL